MLCLQTLYKLFIRLLDLFDKLHQNGFLFFYVSSFFAKFSKIHRSNFAPPYKRAASNIYVFLCWRVIQLLLSRLTSAVVQTPLHWVGGKNTIFKLLVISGLEVTAITTN